MLVQYNLMCLNASTYIVPKHDIAADLVHKPKHPLKQLMLVMRIWKVNKLNVGSKDKANKKTGNWKNTDEEVDTER